MKKLVAILTVLFFALPAISQQQKLEGQVLDKSNNPLWGANIYINSIEKGVQTNEAGKFEINNLKKGKYIVTISSVGFQTKEITFDLTSSSQFETIVMSEGNEILKEFTVESERSNKFSRKETAYVSKLPLKDLENTQVYSTITNELIKSQLITNFDDALKNATGVENLWTSTGRGGDGAGYYGLRGFSIQPQLVNGLPGLTNGTINPANIERIEVLKGPSATLFGNAVSSYGGLINVVTKKPFVGTGGEVAYTTGSYGFNQVMADYNTPLNNKKNMYFRINTAYTTQQSFQDAGFKKSFFVAPSLSYRVNNKLSFSFYGEITESEQTNPTFLFLNRAAPSAAANLDELNYSRELSFTSNDLTLKNPNQNYRAEMDYKISDTWKSQTLVSRSSTTTKGYYSYLYDYGVLPGNTFTRFINKQNSSTLTTDIQQNFIGDFKIKSMRNRIVVGLDYFNQTETSNNTGYVFYGNVTPDGSSNGDNPFTAAVETDVYNLSTSGVDAALASQAVGNAKSSFNTYSIYASDVLNITEKISVMAGLRLDHFDNDGDLTTTDDDFEQTALSPKFGIVYQPIKDKLSIFGNYQNGFTNVAPQLVGDPSDGPQTLQTFDPEQANQMEFGFKTNFFDNKLNATVSYYDIKVTDRVMTDPSSPFNKIQGAEVESTGVEIEVNTNPIKGLNIRAGYSFNQSEITKTDNTEILNTRPLEAGPESLYNFWANYEFQSGKLNGFGIGAGFNGASERFAINYVSTGEFILPSYTIINSTIFYQAKKYRIGLKVNNLLNTEYYKGWTTITPQMPRAVYANFSFQF